MIEWHNAQIETPPAGEIILLNYINPSFYDQTKIVEMISKNIFYDIDSKCTLSTRGVIYWAPLPKIKN